MSVDAKMKEVKANQALIVGRILTMRTFDIRGVQTFETVVVQAAPDAFTPPTRVALQSKKRLGQKEDDVQVLVNAVGYGDSYKTHEGEVITTARNIYRVVE